ncbi:hypothetical protein AeNC1_015231 [Aphanomyces euteiches]|nr:hypothetical protein AeNC1_015231 [Aphanomyces euteiches]
MLSMSRELDRMKSNAVLRKFCVYGDPAYGCSECISSPSPHATPGTAQAHFNAAMSSVRESVEWSFNLVKSKWAFVNWDKKMKVRASPIGKMWLVATLLTNCHTCLQQHDNQISMYFGVDAPLLAEYLGTN